MATDADGSLAAIGVSREQATADLTRLGQLVKSRQREQASELESLHRRYVEAAPPREGEHQSLAYRLRLLFLDRWNLWHRLTRYRQWKGPKGKRLMAPITPVSVPSAGGSKSAIAVCEGTRSQRMPWASVACWPGAATSSPLRTEPIWQGCCRKPARTGNCTACSCWSLSTNYRTITGGEVGLMRSKQPKERRQPLSSLVGLGS